MTVHRRMMRAFELVLAVGLAGSWQLAAGVGFVLAEAGSWKLGAGSFCPCVCLWPIADYRVPNAAFPLLRLV